MSKKNEKPENKQGKTKKAQTAPLHVSIVVFIHSSSHRKLFPSLSSIMGQSQSNEVKEPSPLDYVPKLGWEHTPYGIVRPIVQYLVCTVAEMDSLASIHLISY